MRKVSRIKGIALLFPQLRSPSATLGHSHRFQTTASAKPQDVTEPIYSSSDKQHSTPDFKTEEVEKFEKMASSWWDQFGGQMKELHSMNRLRVPFIRDGLLQSRGQSDRITPKPLDGLTILDIGCGGGILCEPLGRLGAMVTGIDPGQANISVAEGHLPEDLKNKVSYECISIEELVAKENAPKFDGIVMSEVIEHVESPENLVKYAVCLLKPGGSLFLTTINRTLESWAGAIIAWEYVLRRLPPGTHDWRKFMTPVEVERIFRLNDLRTVLIHGMCYNPLNNRWTWSNQRAINYAIHAVKD